MKEKIKKSLNRVWENISVILRILIILFIIIGGLILIDSDASEAAKWGVIIIAVLLIIYFLDDSAHRQIHGDILSGEEEAKKENPFIK